MGSQNKCWCLWARAVSSTYKTTSFVFLAVILIHWQSQAPPGVRSPAELLCVNVLLREALISLSASLLLSIHSSLWED